MIRDYLEHHLQFICDMKPASAIEAQDGLERARMPIEEELIIWTWLLKGPGVTYQGVVVHMFHHRLMGAGCCQLACTPVCWLPCAPT